MTLKENILLYLKHNPGATDTEIEKHLKKRHQQINQVCRELANDEYTIRKRNREKDNFIGNYPTDKIYISKKQDFAKPKEIKSLQEDDIKHILSEYLINNGWDVKVAWGHQQGIDIEAKKNGKRWIIEVKGSGSRQPMRVNYFINILGETLQRMDDINARYSIALPDLEQYRRLWNKLPELAKERTTIDLILVDKTGNINFEN